MKPGMSFPTRRELLVRVAPRYRESTRPEKSIILHEFVAATGYARKYAIRLLTSSEQSRSVIRRPRERQYRRPTQEALLVAWEAANCVCAKRLVPFLPELVPSLERHGHLEIDDSVRAQLLSMSAATADRILRSWRQADKPRGICATKAGKLLKHQVPVRTFTEWDDVRVGFMEADLVAHGGTSAEGVFLQSFVLTDIASGWTECFALRRRGQDTVIQALALVRPLLPFPLLGIDTDNGSEFINDLLVDYCAQEQLTFTRGRVARKNDQCFVEQKNGSVVRNLVGYDRFEGEIAHRQLTELYRAVRLYVNFFQPSMKLQKKRRDGSKVWRQYDIAQTPFQRLCALDALAPSVQTRLSALFNDLDPLRLRRQIHRLQDALWRHAVLPSAYSVDSKPLTAVEFDASACGVTGAVTTAHEVVANALALPAPSGRRAYRRSAGAPTERWWRTRPNPFAEVWDEVCDELASDPDRTAKELLLRLQELYPGRFADGQLRTLQRRVGEWRKDALVVFRDPWLDEERLSGGVLPEPLGGWLQPLVAEVAV